MAKIKVKTHSGTKKRFSLTGTGKVKFQHAYKRHRLVSRITRLRESQEEPLTLQAQISKHSEKPSLTNKPRV